MSSSRAVRLKTTEVEETRACDILESALAGGPLTVICGEIVTRRPNGEIYVDYPQNSLGPLQARTLVEDIHLGAIVLLVFDCGDPSRPIVLGIVHERARAERRTIHLKASRIVLEAQDELTLKCGEGSFEAHGNGRVSLKGRDIVSRATRTNKLRGGTVLIN